MTIASEITKLNTNLTNSYTACQNKGATMPANQNFDNLATCIGSIQTGGSPTLQTKSVSLTDKNGQTFSADNGYDGLSQITVTPNNQARTVTPTKQQQSLTVNSGYSGNGTITVNAVTSSIDSNITAGNIKNGVSILGVTGNYTGTTPTGTLSITQNGTYNVTNYASADVNVSGGGNRKIAPYNCTVEYFDDLPFIKNTYELVDINNLNRSGTFLFTEENMIPVYKADGSTYSNTFLNPSYANQNPNYICKLSTGTYYNPSRITQFYSNPADCPSVLNFGAITTVVFQNALQNLTNLQKVLFPNVTSLSLKACFKGCTNLSVVDMQKVNTLPSNALAGTASTGGAFAGCTSLTTLSFPALTSTSFGSYTNQFNYMLKDVTGCTVHFPSNLQSVIGSWSSVTSGFGGTNTTVLFDLPATT